MAKVIVRYTNGDEDEWELTEVVNLGTLVKTFASIGRDGMVSFAVTSEHGGAADFDFVGVRTAELSTWRVEGLVDPGSAAAIWDELQRLDGEDLNS